MHLAFLCNAQVQEVDSLKQLLTTTSDTLTQIQLLNEITYLHCFFAPQEGLDFGKRAIILGTNFESTAEVARTNLNLAIAYHLLEEWDSVAYHADQSLDKATILQDTSIQIRALNMLATMYKNTQEPKKALAFYEKGLAIGLTSADSLWAKSTFYTNIGSIYGQLGNYSKAMDYFERTLKLYEANGNLQESIVALLGISNICNKAGMYDKEIRYLKKAKELSIQTKDEYGLLLSFTGIVPHYANKPDSVFIAIQYAEEALTLAKDIGARHSEVFMLVNLTDIYREKQDLVKANNYFEQAKILIEQGLENPDALFAFYGSASVLKHEQAQYDAALDFANKMLDLATKNERLEEIKLAQQNQSAAYEGQGDFEAALVAYKGYQGTKDSIDNLSSIQKVVRLEAELTNTKQEKDLALLIKNNVELEAKSSRNQIIILSMGLFIFLSLFFLWATSRQNKLISKQNKAIELKNEQLKQVNATKDRIFAILAHDLRKPVLSFRGIPKKVNYLLQKGDYTTLDALGNDIEYEAQRLYKITDNLLNWALLQKNVMPYQPIPLALKRLSEDTINLFQHLLDEKQIILQNEIPASTEVYADKNSLLFIIRNLLDNAIKYTLVGGKIILKATQTEEGIQLQISDTGIGIADNRLKDIFLLNTDKSTNGTANEPGIGLGLHLIKGLTQLNKGSIDVVSEIGKGTTFNLLLPTL